MAEPWEQQHQELQEGGVKRHQVHSDQPLIWAERSPADHVLGSFLSHSAGPRNSPMQHQNQKESRQMAGAVRRSQDEVREAWLWSPDSAGSPSTPVGKGSRASCLCIPASAHLLQTTREPHPAHLRTHWETPLLAPLLWPSSPAGGRGPVINLTHPTMRRGPPHRDVSGQG